MIWIAVDAMGGDYAPRLVVDGALSAVRDFEFGVALVGPADLLGAELRRHADVDTVASGEASALFSAGHTGATVMAAYTAFGMLPGVDRPALAATIPRPQCPAILLDVGASVECRPAHLVQFAVMGSVYARLAFG